MRSKTVEAKMSLPIPNEQPTAYETANQVLNPPPSFQGKERRAAKRHPFRFVQRIAAYDGQDDLAALRFFPVQCYDISRRGIAFLLPSQLDFSKLVVELASADEQMYFEAEVVNYRNLTESPEDEVGTFLSRLGPSGEAPHAVLIGCRFTKRLRLLPA
jgi:hypothetical protein